MFYKIDLLSGDDLESILIAANSIDFADGAATASNIAKSAKHNLQATDFDKSDAAKLVRLRLIQSEKFKLAAIPLRLSELLLCKYEQGMTYGAHADNALMQTGKLKADLAFTLFLSAPTTYGGGELSVYQGDSENLFKLPAGSMLLYPASFLHKVQPVTTGVRLAVVGWVQSMISDPAKRSIIHDLTIAQSLMSGDEAKQDAQNKLSLAIANLLRLWAEN